MFTKRDPTRCHMPVLLWGIVFFTALVWDTWINGWQGLRREETK